MTKTYDADVIVVGGGHSGLTLSALLASHGVGVICIDREDPATTLKGAFDGRTTAISYGSQKVIAAGGGWEAIENKACPIKDIRILDGDSPTLLTFLSEDAGGELQNQAFGWIVENRDLRKVLYDRLEKLDRATHIAPAQVQDFAADEDGVCVHLADGRALRAKLLVGADGRGSFVREKAGITTRGWTYGQNALVCTVTHENPHYNVAVEHFRPEGPFAILPMTDAEDGAHRSAVVWTEHAKTRRSAQDFDEDTFNTALNARFPAEYGKVRLAGKRFSYPLGLIHAHNYVAERLALVADAAHGIHPIAGQGLNIGLRDIAALAGMVIEAHADGTDIGGTDLLNRYQRARRFDNMTMAAATDALNKLFSNDLPPVRMARRLGLRAVQRIIPARRFFMRQAMGAGINR